MDVGKDTGGTAAVAATRPVPAADAIGLLTRHGGLTTGGDRASSPRTPAHAGSTQPVAPTVAELSDGAQLLLKLMGSTVSAGTATAINAAGLSTAIASALHTATPLLPAAPDLADASSGASAMRNTGHASNATNAANAASASSPGTAAIAHALQTGLEHSGLFYESHLADWIAGQRSTSAIRAEPQAASPDNAGVLAAIVHAQLDLLDHGQLRWQGELWPGQLAELWLQRDTHQAEDPHQQQQDNAEPGTSDDARSGRRWQARLVTTLPVLGKISTQFTLQGDRIELKLSSAEPGTATTLQSASAQLAGMLHHSGLQLQGFVSHVDDEQGTR